MLNILAVSEILTFKFILAFNAEALSTNEVRIFVESDLILVVIIVESNKIFALIAVILSAKAPPAALPKALILFDRDAVSLANLESSILAVSEIFNLVLILFESATVSLANLLFNIEAVSLKFNFKAKESEASDAEDKLKAIHAELFKSGVLSLYNVSTDCTKTNIPNFLL